MATRRVMVGDQEIEIPEFNFKITPVIIGALVMWLLTGIYIVGPDGKSYAEPCMNLVWALLCT